MVKPMVQSPEHIPSSKDIESVCLYGPEDRILRAWHTAGPEFTATEWISNVIESWQYNIFILKYKQCLQITIWEELC